MKQFKYVWFCLCVGYTLLSAQVNINFRSNLPYPGQTCANIWGYVDSLGNEYALVGASKGLSIVNVTNPDSPFEVIQIPGPDNLWKEVKTWGKYAYVVSEGGGGLQIIDLRKLPGTNLPSKYWEVKYMGDTLVRAHSLHIDNGFAYLYGGTYKGALICDLADPWNPVAAGLFNMSYIHDGYVRNNVLYGSHIYTGYFSIIDVSNKSTPTLIQTQTTSKQATHNTWLSDDSKTLFTTDETSGSFLDAYDVSNSANITLLDMVQSNPGSGSVVHNCHVKSDWVVCSYYKDGVVIFDGHRPTNLVQVADFDTDTANSGNGYTGAWGVYPYLPSGTIVVSNINEGLFVLSPTYKRACYLEGIVTDSVTGLPINTANVDILTTSIVDSTKLTGNYAIGTVVPGTYTVQVSKSGYITRTIGGINLSAGNVTILNVKLKPVSNSIDDQNGALKFNVYPNPFSDKFSISYSFIDELSSDGHLIVTDITGRLLIQQAIKSKAGVISIEGIHERGIYFAQITNGNTKSHAVKLLKLQ